MGEDLTNELYQQEPVKGAEPSPPPAVTIPLDRVDPKYRLFDSELGAPSGGERIRTVGDSWTYEWTGAQRDVAISPGATPNEVKLTVKEASLHRIFVQLHKAKGSTLFKAYATVLAISLFLLVATGLAVGLMAPAFRSLTIWTSGIGLAAFVGAVLLG